MGQKIFSWGNTRRYNSWTDQCRQKYGGRLQKVSVNAGFTCPNRDGTVGRGGCSFCNNEGFSPSYCHDGDSISRQLDLGIEFLDRRYRQPAHFLAYFQAYSNTHAGVEVLEERYLQALSHPRISGIVVGTRPDCVDEQKLDLLAGLSRSYIVSIEYGIESCYDQTLVRINRGHNFGQSERAIRMSAERGIHTGAHLIFGLPGESHEQMLEQASVISSLPLHSIKFHQLQIVKGTAIALEYQQNPEAFQLFGMHEYVEFVTSFAERLRPDISIGRFSGEVPPRFNAGPSWGGIRADQIMGLVEKEFLKRDSWQGKYLQH